MTLNANSAGIVQGRFTIPANIPVGAKAVVVDGANGSHGVATFTGRGTITTEERRLVTTITQQYYDPLAQTFSLSEGRHIAAADLWFTVAGAVDVIVQIRETDNGFPSRAVVAEKRLTPSAINIGGNSTRVTFEHPVWLEASKEYALVILTDGADATVSVAELGKFDSGAQKWITSQAYQVGVLLSSSNASTWTAHQEKDLAFRLMAARFTETSRVIPLGTVAASDVSDFIALANIEIPATGTSAEIVATAPDGTEYRMSPSQPINLASRVNGNVSLALHLTGTTKASPVAYPGMQFVAGDQADSATYISRSFVCGTNGRISVTFEAYCPGTSNVAVAIKKQDGTWQTLSLTSGSEIGNGWVERRHVLTGFTADTTAVKLTLTGSAQYRPRIRKLRAVATD